MQNLSSSHQSSNSSKAQSALDKFHVLRERTRQTLQVEIAKEEKGRQRIRFTLGQSILDNPRLCELVVAVLPPDLQEQVAVYRRLTASIAELRSQMP